MYFSKVLRNKTLKIYSVINIPRITVDRLRVHDTFKVDIQLNSSVSIGKKDLLSKAFDREVLVCTPLQAIDRDFFNSIGKNLKVLNKKLYLIYEIYEI